MKRRALLTAAILLASCGAVNTFAVMQGKALHPAKGEAANEQPIEITGHVVDAETGKPIEQFIEQGGRIDSKDPTKISWGWSEGRSFYRDDPSRLHATLNWKSGDRLRILANGYLPEPVITEPPAKGVHEIEVTVRLKRGQSVIGKVVDPAGNAVRGAAVFLCGNRSCVITEGKAVSGYPRAEDRSFTRTVTDSEGRFTLWGAGAELCSVAVSASSVDLWVVPAPVQRRDLVIQLPRSGTLIIRYDIDGAEADGAFSLELVTRDMKDWIGARNDREPKVTNTSSLVLANLTPGKYLLSRSKTVNGRGTFLCERRVIEVESGKTVDASFTRSSGQSIEGQVLNSVPDKRAKVYIILRPPNATGNLRSGDDWRLPVFTAAACASDGKFKTERIMPGEYKVFAEGYLPEDPTRAFTTGIRLPDFVGVTKVTVPEEGKLGLVVVRMKPHQTDK